MNVRTYGFNFDRKLLPDALPAKSIFEIMAANSGARIGTSYQFGVSKVTLPLGGKTQEWWGGMMVRIRDSRGYLKLTEKAGKAVLTEETLGEGERLAEISFFLAHPETGNGLLTHHYHATSFYSFGRVCSKVFDGERRIRRDAALSEPNIAGNEKKVIREAFAGKLEMGQLLIDADFKQLVKELRRVSSVDFKLTTVKSKEKLFQGVAVWAASERVKFMFHDDVDILALADALDESSQSDSVEAVQVVGRDRAGEPTRFTNHQNPAVFDEYDYDEMMKGLRLDLTDWAGSIQKSAAIRRLGKVAAGATVMQLLTKA